MASNTASQSKPTGITSQLCRWIHDTKISDIPPEIVERAKYLILDGIACGLVAAHLTWSETAANAIFKVETQGQCTIIGWKDKKLSPMSAALLNSTFVQGFELDDFHSRAPLHSNSLLLPALFAATEVVGATEDGTAVTFSGNDLLRSYVIGCELGPRVGLALHGADLLSRGWHSGAIQGPSAACAATSSLLGLDPTQLESALGIACTQAGGLMAAQFASDAKRMQHGFSSRNGLFATLLARENYTGIQGVFETPYGGFLSCFSQGANFEPASLPDELISGLGQRWEIEGVKVKLHAAMGATLGTIDCIERLQSTHADLFSTDNLDSIEKIVTYLSRPAYEHGGWDAPADKMSSLGAQMSCQYVAAAQLLDGEVLMSQFGAANLHRPQVRKLMDKVHPEHDASFDGPGKPTLKTTVTVHFKTGETVSETFESPRGIEPSLANQEIVDKWRRLVRGVIDDQTRDDIESKVLGLDRLENVKELVELLGTNAQCPIDV